MLPNEIKLDKKYTHTLIGNAEEAARRVAKEMEGVDLPKGFDFKSPDIIYRLIYGNGPRMSYRTAYLVRDTLQAYNTKNKYSFDITNKLDWKAGDFQDDGSCFWNGRKHHRTALKKHGCRAVRFYKGSSGIGRAWAWPYKKTDLVLFNAYGLHLSTIGIVLAQFFEVDFKVVSIARTPIYINNDAILISADTDKIEKVSLGIKLTCKCVDCSKNVLEKNMGFVSKLDDRDTGLCKKCLVARDGNYCRKCAAKCLEDDDGEYISCTECGE